MRRDEWEAIALLMDNCWRGGFDETMSSSYFSLLNRFSAEQVMGALHRIIENGKPFVPAVPEIVAAIRAMEEPQLPPWTEVWNALKGALRRPNEEAAVAYLTSVCHPAVGAFLRLEGFDRLRHEPFFDPDYGPLRIKELRERWAEFADTAKERERTGRALDSGARRNTLERVSAKALISQVSAHETETMD